MALYVLSNPYDAQKFREKAETFLREGKAVVELKKKHPPRSLAQNNYAHLCFAFFGAEVGMDAESVKYEVFKKICNPDTFVHKKTIIKDGKQIEIESVRSSAFLDTEQFTLCLERFRNWSASEMGIYIPAANEHEGLLHAQQVIERNAEFE